MARKLRQIKGYLWNGNLHDGQLVIDDLVADLEECETASEITKVLQKAANDILTYISNCAWMIPNGIVKLRGTSLRGMHSYDQAQAIWRLLRPSVSS